MQATSGAKTYQLRIRVAKPARITVGKLGEFHLPPGTYVYTGSARRHLVARISRHLARAKKLRWHIDYLLSHADVEITDVELWELEECAVNQATSGEILISRFGASDCRFHCGSHLKYLGEPAPTAGDLRPAHDQTGLPVAAP